VVCGSAITGAGIGELRRVLTEILPTAAPQDGPPAGTVFALDRDERGRRAWVRLWSGGLRVRDRVSIAGRPAEPLTEVAVSAAGGLRLAPAGAGQIAVLRGPVARIGETIGRPPRRRSHRFAPATLQAVVAPVDPAQRTAMFAGLTELAEEDPLIGLHVEPERGEAAVSLHGEVQREVIAALLQDRFGVQVEFSATSVVCLERVLGCGRAVERIHERGNPYLAGIGLRIEAAAVGHGIEFSPGIQRGHLPPAFINATEEGVRAALRQGLNAWSVTDCVVTMTTSQYWPRQSRPHQKFDKSISSIAADFRHLAPVVLMAALRQARTVVCRPVEWFDLDLPDAALPALTPVLGRLGAATTRTSVDGGYVRLGGYLPSAAVPDLSARLPDLTSGEGVLVTRLDHHEPVAVGNAPVRRRTGPDPLDREGWFRAMPR
jgi:ribosomal protection tetracycline resistance protein